MGLWLMADGPMRHARQLRALAGIGGVTPVHMAAVLGDAEIVSALLDRGCPLDEVTDEVRRCVIGADID